MIGSSSGDKFAVEWPDLERFWVQIGSVNEVLKLVIKLLVVVCSASQFVGYYNSKRPPALLCREKRSVLPA
jgi:uncharacterized membrane protein YGL010W